MDTQTAAVSTLGRRSELQISPKKNKGKVEHVIITHRRKDENFCVADLYSK